MIVNFHIGAPRIGEELLRAVSAAASLSSHPELLVLSQDTYREFFRSLINSRESVRSKKDQWQAAEEKIQSLTKFSTIAISQHAALGEHSDLIFSERGIERAIERLATLSSIFERNTLRLIFTITSQVEYLNWTLGPDARAAIAAGRTISWSNLLRRLKVAVPHRQFVVWDFERPQNVALAFVAEMLGTHNREFLTDAREMIRGNRSYKDYMNMHCSLEDIDDSLARLDDQYDTDLDAISKMDGVTLIRSDEVPSEFRL